MGSSVTQINLIFDTIIASFLITGSISWLYMSDRFIELPLALFGISIATVLLPKLSEYHSKSDTESYNSTMNWGSKAWHYNFPAFMHRPNITCRANINNPITI